MRVVYTIVDQAGRQMYADIDDDGHVKVTMNFSIEKGLTLESVFSTLGWTIVERNEYQEPKVIPFERKD